MCHFLLSLAHIYCPFFAILVEVRISGSPHALKLCSGRKGNDRYKVLSLQQIIFLVEFHGDHYQTAPKLE